jgi:hypothetical protein
VVLRAIQSSVSKEVYKELSTGDEKIDSPLIMKVDYDYMFHVIDAGTRMECDTIEVAANVVEDYASGVTDESVITTIYHEMDHLIRGKREKEEIIQSMDDYKVHKSLVVTEYDESILAANYNNRFLESCAYIAGALAVIRALRMFPAGENDTDIQRKINFQTFIIKKFLNSTINNQIRYYDKSSQQWKSDIDVLVFDRVYKEAAYKKESPLFEFEYHDDGTPKELFEIIMDHQRELETGELHPEKGPKGLTERAKFRFQVMMERAMVTHQEEMCYAIMMDYVKKHKEQFQEDSLFKNDFPSIKDFSSYSFDTLIDNRLKDGKKEGFQDALFLVRLQAMAERIQFKEGFGENVFLFYQKAFGLNNPNLDKTNSEGHSNPIPE